MPPARARVLRGSGPHRQARQPHGQGRLQEAPALLGASVFTSGGLLPRHVFEPLKGAGSRDAIGMVKPVGHRPVQARRVQARRLDPRRDQPHLSRAEPALLRSPRDQVRRRLAERGPRRDADRRVRLRLLRADGGGHAAPPRAGPAKGRILTIPSQRRELHPVQPERPVDRGGRRAVEPPVHAPLPRPTPRCAPRSASSSTGRRSRSTWSAAPARSPPTSSMPRTGSARSNTTWEFNVDKANQILDQAGWARGARRHPRQGRQAPQDALPGRRQCHRAEGPGGGQAGGGARGHRDRGQGRPGLGVLLRRT